MKKIFLALVLLVFNTIIFAQEKSLLWEISGNGLKKPSYIYGTMHVSSKVAFRLDDVFYEALNKSESIALESDPTQWLKFMHEDLDSNTMMDSYYYENDFYSNLFKLSPLDPVHIRSVIRFDNRLINNYLYRNDLFSNDFEEDTYLDMFIYQAGKKNNKPIIGLEKFRESKYLTTKASYNPNKKKPDPWFIELMEKKNMYLFQEDVYRERDIELLDSIGAAVNTEYYREHMLFKRNENMVNVLDSIMHKKIIFSGVGAAHLGGEKGMLNMLKEKGYTIKPLVSKQTTSAKHAKNKLENLFIKPDLSFHSTGDGFITIKSFDKLREFNTQGIKYYIAPDMTNGAYLSINRLNTFAYLPNKKDHVDLNYIKNLLYEDIPGTIIKTTEFSTPYPGISILNKTKKGDYQKYHIYKTPLEIIVIKFGGKKDFILQYEAEIFNSITFKPYSKERITFSEPNNKYSFTYPKNYITDNLEHSGKKLIQATLDDDYYFFQESPHHDIEYIEEDRFEAKYIHTNFYKDLKIKKNDGAFEKGDYKSYVSSATLDSINNKKLWLKSVIKDGSYYLLGYCGKNENNASTFFNSLQFKSPKYEHLKKIKDTSLYFVTQSPVKAPHQFQYYQYSIDKNKNKPYEELIKNTVYKTKANEQIFVERIKFHDLEMHENVDSLWNDLNVKLDYLQLEGIELNKKFKTTNEKRYSENGVNYLTHKLRDSLSNKEILVKYIQKKGVLYKLSTLTDSISKPSKFITEFFDAFKPMDTLLGKDIFKDKAQLFFDALKRNDTIALNGYYHINFSKKHTSKIIEILEENNLPENKQVIKNYLLSELIENDKSEMVTNFIEKLYVKSYSDPTVQQIILNALFRRKNKASFDLMLKLLNTDLPLGSKTPSFNVYNKKIDSLKATKLLFPKLLNFSSVEDYKTPIYRLLSKLLDSNIVKPNIYKSYKNQIINDAKTQIKRSLGNKSTYSYSRFSNFNLNNYVKLLFPYRKEKNVKLFYLRLLESDDWQALTTYYVLLTSENEFIPEQLKDKTLLNESAQHLLVKKLKIKDLLSEDIKTVIDLKTYAKSKLFNSSYFKKDENDISFFKEKKLVTDNDKNITLLIFKRKNKNQNIDNESLHFIAFEDSKTDLYPIKPFYESSKYGEAISGFNTIENIIEDAILLIKHKTRKRINKKNNASRLGLGF